jgi:uncharacterized membrane protein YkvA (DUF1232 family)
VIAVAAWQWLLLVIGVMLVVYAAVLAALVLAGRRGDARELANFVPDCLLLFRALLRDPRVPRRRKALLAVLVAYLAMPIDLVPDFIPVAGQLDDAIVIALVLRSVLRSGGSQLLREHWRGTERSLGVVLRLAGAPG